MKAKFFLSAGFGGLWLAGSLLLSRHWAGELSRFWPAAYVWWVIIGIALLPGFLMSGMFFSNLLHQRLRAWPPAREDVTVLVCAHNEEAVIARAIGALLAQDYPGHIRVLAVDNASTDHTRQEILRMSRNLPENRSVEYLYCPRPGKANALNAGLAQVATPHFLTVDADTFLEKRAVGRIMGHILARGSACVAGNLFVGNAGDSLVAGMQTYDYLLSIAAVKRYQGSYGSTLVAQGAFSAYETAAVRQAGGWPDRLGEDIVLTYRLLSQGRASTYEPGAVGYTTVPHTLNGLYNQRKRWAIGMLEGLAEVAPWKQSAGFARYFEMVNLSVIWLDLAFLFGFLPGVILAALGYWYLVGLLTLFTAAVGAAFFFTTYRYQRSLGIPFQNNLPGFLFFFLFFQLIQSTASLQGYCIRLLGRKGEWK